MRNRALTASRWNRPSYEIRQLRLLPPGTPTGPVARGRPLTGASRCPESPRLVRELLRAGFREIAGGRAHTGSSCIPVFRAVTLRSVRRDRQGHHQRPWRRAWDSNPEDALTPYATSNRAPHPAGYPPSGLRPPLLGERVRRPPRAADGLLRRPSGLYARGGHPPPDATRRRPPSRHFPPSRPSAAASRFVAPRKRGTPQDGLLRGDTPRAMPLTRHLPPSGLRPPLRGSSPPASGGLLRTDSCGGTPPARCR